MSVGVGQTRSVHVHVRRPREQERDLVNPGVVNIQMAAEARATMSSAEKPKEERVPRRWGSWTRVSEHGKGLGRAGWGGGAWEEDAG